MDLADRVAIVTGGGRGLGHPRTKWSPDGGWNADDVAYGWRVIVTRAESVAIPPPGSPSP